MSIRLQNKLALVLAAFMFTAVGSVYARGYNGQNSARHYLALSLGGGEANNIAKSGDNLHPIAGGAGNAMLSYEIEVSHVLFAIGLQAQYQLTRDTLAPFHHSFDRKDIMGDVAYEYRYSAWLERSHDLRLTIPVRVGYQAGDYVYFLLGADVSLPLMTSREASTTMFSQGTHPFDSEPWRTDERNNFVPFGYYPAAQYTGKGTYKENMWVAVSAEVGSYIPLKASRVRMRAGAYINYNIRLGERTAKPIVDYSAIDMNALPNTQSPEFLQNTMVLNSALNSAHLTALPGNLEVGIRWTTLFDVTIHHKPCMCTPTYLF